MGESTCLLRSFSNPAESSGAVQGGNPMRVLGESVSFGRFMSESLDWEKWSTFSHNRYVEEAEKYSKPGSVAAKKAYFEAHYKRKAAEKATALIQEPNAQAVGNFDSKTWKANHADSAVMAESEADGIVTANVQQDKDAFVYQVVDCADANQYKCDVGQSSLDISNVEEARDFPHPCTGESFNVESCIIVDDPIQFHKCDVGQSSLDISNVEEARDVPHPCTGESFNVESCIIVDDPIQFHNAEPHKNIDFPAAEKISDPRVVDGAVLPLPVKGRKVNSSPKLSTKTRNAKLPLSLNERKAAAALPPRSGINKKTVRVLGENSRLTARSLCFSINLPSGTGETSKTASAAAQSKSGINSVSKSKKHVEGSIEKKQVSAHSLYKSVNLPSCARETGKTATVKPSIVINHESKSMKSVGDSVKKRPTTRSLHMSINLPSRPGETSKMASLLERNRMEKDHSNLPNDSKDHPMAPRTSTKASHGFSNQYSENPLSQGRRSERLLNKSVSGGVTANAKLLSSSADCFNSSSTSKNYPRPHTTSSPFRFRSEERAVKRKELLQRIDEVKNKEAEKVQLQRTTKEKAEHDDKKLRHSSVFKSKPNEGKNQTRKTSLTQIQSPKFGRKVNAGTVQDKNLPKSSKPSINTNNSKRNMEKVNRTTRHSVTSLLSITRENASPNIQLRRKPAVKEENKL